MPCLAIAGDVGHWRYPNEPLFSLAIDVPNNLKKFNLCKGEGIRRVKLQVKGSGTCHGLRHEYFHLVEIIIVLGPPQIHALVEFVHARGHSLGVGKPDPLVSVPDSSD